MIRETKQTDLLIIGAGPGGYVAAIYAAKKGLKVTLVDQKYVGGTCLNIGCIPTKSLVKSAELFEAAKHADAYGVHIEQVTFDLEKAIARKSQVTKTLVEGIDFLLQKNGVEVVYGTATFLSDSQVKVQTEQGEVNYLPNDIIIATGAKTKHLPIEGLDNDFVFDSEGLLNNRKLPKSLAVIGGGIIGMEFAFIYGHYGVEVSVLEFLPSILPTVDKDLSQRLIRYAKMANINIYTSAKVTKIERSSEGKAVVRFLHKDSEKTVEADMVLEAVGRVANLDGLGMERTSVLMKKPLAIEVDQKMKTSCPHIYAIGDVTNIMQLAHVASHQALVAIDQITGKDSQMDYDYVPSVIFTTPQIATVGKNELDLQQAQHPYQVVKIPFSANGKALISDSSQGFIKLILDENTKEALGAQVFGNDAEHLIASLTIALTNHLSAEAIKETIFAHPTLSELIHEGAMASLNEPIHFLG